MASPLVGMESLALWFATNAAESVHVRLKRIVVFRHWPDKLRLDNAAITSLLKSRRKRHNAKNLKLRRRNYGCSMYPSDAYRRGALQEVFFIYRWKSIATNTEGAA